MGTFTTNLTVRDGITAVSSHPGPDGVTAVTIAGPTDLVTLVCDEHALRELHRETGPDRSALGTVLHLVEVPV